MVSIVLLTTEEVLQRNGFWQRLDTLWITQEMEPFEEVKPEHIYSKPLSRDYYYTKFPDIPRSESEDENSLTVSGFKSKHEEWKSKIGIRKFVLRKRHSSQSNRSVKSGNRSDSASSNDITNRAASLEQKSRLKDGSVPSSNDKKVRAFLNRLIENIPPPPLEDLPNVNGSMKKPQFNEDLSDVDLPDYAKFEKDKIQRRNDEQSLIPSTSTLKRSKRRVSFSLSSLKSDVDTNSWYETVYGISELISRSKNDVFDSCNNLQTEMSDSDCFISWSEIMNTCGLNDNIFKSRESLEKIVSQSHGAEAQIADLSQHSQQDEEYQYAQFAINKIYQTLKIQKGLADSSSVNDFNCEYNVNPSTTKALESDPTFYKTIYRLAPENDDDKVPPENELQKNSDRVLSEHELRVQRSLQKLNVPEWYKNAPAPREGFLLRKRLSDASASAARWSGLNSKTTSLGSLGANPQPPPPQLSPHTTSFGRWSTSRLNSNQTSPCSSTRSSIRGTSPLCSPSTRSSFSARQPYLGWRSQERLNTTPRTPHERLASSILQQSASSKASEEIQTSIKEVTSAIVHYVSGLEPANGDVDRQPSPRSSQKLYWLESSFVGTKPLESPQTPLVVSEALPPPHPRPPSSLRLDHRAAPGERA